jgi:hypothetical protein
MTESPRGPSVAITTFSLVPGGKFTMRVLGSAPSSTFRSVGVDWTGFSTWGLVIFSTTIEGVFAESGLGAGRARTSGTPITTTYIRMNAPTNPRPYAIKSL